MYQATETRYQSMPYHKCGNSGLKLPAVSFGLWHNFGDNASYETMRQLCFTAFDNGITHFDLANNYGPVPGSAERNFGHIFNENFRAYRDEMLISTKAGYDMWKGPYGDWGSRKYLLASLDQSLKRLGLEYVDIYYHHRMDPETPLEETMGALAQAVSSGKALYVGLSNYDGETMEKAAGILEELNNLAIMRGQALADLALAWILRDGKITSVLVGASKSSQILENIGALRNTVFTEEELKIIDQISLRD